MLIGAEIVRGQLCQGTSLLGAEMSSILLLAPEKGKCDRKLLNDFSKR